MKAFSPKRRRNSKTNEREKSSERKGVKYEHPKILLIDMDPEALKILDEKGYNVSFGSFGKPYKVDKADDALPVINNGKLPTYFAESTIVVVDLTISRLLPKAIGEKHTTRRELDWWCKCSSGFIDPRPRLMSDARESLDRILRHGGIVIVFADPRLKQDLFFAKIGYQGVLDMDVEIGVDNWSFLSVFQEFEVEIRNGSEMKAIRYKAEILNSLGEILDSYLMNGEYTCTLSPPWRLNKDWIEIAKQKHGESVAGVIKPLKENYGWVFIFPQIKEKSQFLVDFIGKILPEVSPRLFPEFEGMRWIHRPEYEHLSMLALKQKIRDVREKADKQESEIQKIIDKEETAYGYLHDLITETGDSLVQAAKRALEVLGFKAVVDMDKQSADESGDVNKHEDLQICDYSPLVLVEVKGISGHPRDADALQAQKYVAPRMQEMERLDIRALAIINHHKNIPPLERDNNKPFREDILKNARRQKFGLMTTFDLFRLVRGYLRNSWTHENVKDLFYQDERIDPVPSHYEYIGKVDKYYDNISVVLIELEASEIDKGDRIAFCLPTDFLEQEVESMQKEKQDTDHGEKGDLVGIKTSFTKEQLKKKIEVYRIKKS